MTFLDAVRELIEGRCKGIKREEWFHQIMLVVKEQFVSLSHPQFVGCTPADYLAEDWILVDPIPQTEEVEVVAYQCGFCKSFYDDTQKACQKLIGCTTKGTLVKLTGTYTREKKQQVKRREEISIRDYEDWDFVRNCFNQPRDFHGAKFYIEWEGDAP